MTFAVAVPFGGIAGWSFLTRTRTTQFDALSRSPRLERDVDNFRTNVGKAKSAGDLVNDRQLLSVALGAFGLSDDMNNRYFIRKVLESNLADPLSLANRLSDKRYLGLAKAFGYGRPGAQGPSEEAVENILGRYKEMQFEQSVGEQDGALRQALAVNRELDEIVNSGLSDRGKWFLVMGNPPLRQVFEKALGLPRSLGTQDIDRQFTVFHQASQRALGTGKIDEIAQDDIRERLVHLFLSRSSTTTGARFSPARSAALSILLSDPGATAPLLELSSSVTLAR